MKISFNQLELKTALERVGRAVSSKVALPILHNILIVATTEAQASQAQEDQSEGQGGRVKLAATNLEISITVWVAAQIIEEGEITVPARLLTDFVSNMDVGSKVILTLDKQTLKLNVRSGRAEANLSGTNTEDFPALPSVTNPANRAVITSSVFKEAVGQVGFAASSDETRPVLTGIFANFSDDTLTMAAADSFRLAVRTAPLAEPTDRDFSVILPARAMIELARIVADDDSRIEFSITQNKSQALFKTDTVSFTSSLIEGNFPNYQQIIPKSYTTRTVISTQELARVVKAASYFAKDTDSNIVMVSITPGQDLAPGRLMLSANSAQVGDNHSEIDATVEGTTTTTPVQIAFNAKYISDVLGILGTSQAALELQDPSRPGVVRPVGKDDYVHVMMPMHLAQTKTERE